MDIKEFIQLCAGKWFSLRSVYLLNENKTENNKAEVTVEILSTDLPKLVTLCQSKQIDSNGIIAGMKLSWDNSVDWGKPKQVGSNTVVLIAGKDNLQEGKLLRKMGTQEIKIGSYLLAEDEAITFTIEDGATYWQERVWFASDNLRLRRTLLKQGVNFQVTSFYSEIRKIAPKNKQ